VTFRFEIHSPPDPGDYRFRWRMVQEHVEWFGDFTPDTPIGVGPPTGRTIVPDVRESTPADAADAIRAADLVPAFTGQSGSGSWVASQSPRAGDVVSQGTTVRCQLRRGPIP
jgi:hypothetical protein